MRVFQVSVYEPAVDPGGYDGTFRVVAAEAVVARQLALGRAAQQWPDAHGNLAVWNVEEIGPDLDAIEQRWLTYGTDDRGVLDEVREDIQLLVTYARTLRDAIRRLEA